MAVWTIVPDSAQLPDQPIKSSEQIAIKNNITALAEGAAGAPRIVNLAIEDSTLGAEKFQIGASESAWVLGRTADASVGDVGTYALAVNVGNINVRSPGSPTAGSDLRYASADGDAAVGGLPGSWRAMGTAFGSGEPDASKRTTVFLRYV